MPRAIKKTAVSEDTAKKETTTAVKTADKPKALEPSDLVACRSVFSGTLHMSGKKSGSEYKFVGFNDEEYVEYQDLQALMITNSSFIFKPLIVIEDDRVFTDKRWDRVKALYDSMYGKDDVKEILELNNRDFEATLKTLPSGLVNAIATEITTRVLNGSFDSIKKIMLIDEMCGTEIKKLLLGE